MKEYILRGEFSGNREVNRVLARLPDHSSYVVAGFEDETSLEIPQIYYISDFSQLKYVREDHHLIVLSGRLEKGARRADLEGYRILGRRSEDKEEKKKREKKGKYYYKQVVNVIDSLEASYVIGSYLAKGGHKTLILNADRYTPGLGSRFDISLNGGYLDDFIAGFPERIESFKDRENLYIVTGMKDLFSSESIGVRSYAQILSELRNFFDYVVLHSNGNILDQLSIHSAAYADRNLFVTRISDYEAKKARDLVEFIEKIHGVSSGKFMYLSLSDGKKFVSQLKFKEIIGLEMLWTISSKDLEMLCRSPRLGFGLTPASKEVHRIAANMQLPVWGRK